MSKELERVIVCALFVAVILFSAKAIFGNSVKELKEPVPFFTDETVNTMKQLDKCAEYQQGTVNRYLCTKKILDTVKASTSPTEKPCTLVAEINPSIVPPLKRK